MTKTKDVPARHSRWRFVRSFVAHPRQVGSLVPTSHRTVAAMLDMADVPRADCVVELGAGTGVFTEQLLERMSPDGTLLAFEIDSRLAEALLGRFADVRVRVLAESAENLLEHLEDRRADVIVSALPLTTLPDAIRTHVLDAITTALAPGGVMLAIQYSTLRQSELEERFASITRRHSALNVPPAFLFACREPRRG